MQLRRASNQASIVLGKELGRGGEGAVHPVVGVPDLVAKIYLKPPSAHKVEKLRKGIVHFTLEGEVKMKSGQREIEAKIRGKAAWNTLKNKFDEFELVIAGTRTGRSQFNAREDDQAKAGIGWVLTLAGDKPVDKIAPAEFGQYGWR